MTESQLIKKELKLDIKQKIIAKKQAELNKMLNVITKSKTVYMEAVKYMKAGTKYEPILLKPSNEYIGKPGRMDIVISDVHYSGKVDDQRIRKFFKKQITTLAQRYSGQHVRLIFLGDDIEGELHLSSLDKHQEENTVNQIRGIQKHYANFIASVNQIVGKKMDIVFVPESNHGQLRLHGMDRGQQPRNDVGYIIRDFIMETAPKGVKFWASKNGIVETEDSFYMHGDKGYMKTADKVRLTLGSKKNIVMGHFHSFKVSQHGSQYIIVAPKGTNNEESYTNEAGYPISLAAGLFIENTKGRITGWSLVEVE